MNGKKESRCPGCSRRCKEGNVRCKYGRSYFEERKADSQKAVKDRKYKWERYVETGSTVWKLLRLNAELKRAIKDGDLTEQQIMCRLTDEERQVFEGLLDRMSEVIEKCRADV